MYGYKANHKSEQKKMVMQFLRCISVQCANRTVSHHATIAVRCVFGGQLRKELVNGRHSQY